MDIEHLDLSEQLLLVLFQVLLGPAQFNFFIACLLSFLVQLVPYS